MCYDDLKKEGGLVERTNNYLIQASQAKDRFLTYDQRRLVEKFSLNCDAQYLYMNLLFRPYRISRKTGDLEFWDGTRWCDGNSYEEVMTLLDLLCDSRDDRWLSGNWKNTQSFGLLFHRNLLEEARDPLAERIDRDPRWFCRACEALNGGRIPGGDYGYGVELFDGLKIGILFWHGDEEFAPRLRYLWDANANMYLRYETMYFAIGLLKQRLMEQK